MSDQYGDDVARSTSNGSLLRLWFPLTVAAVSLTSGIILATHTGIHAPLPVLQGLVATVAVLIQIEAIVKRPDEYGVGL